MQFVDINQVGQSLPNVARGASIPVASQLRDPENTADKVQDSVRDATADVLELVKLSGALIDVRDASEDTVVMLPAWGAEDIAAVGFPLPENSIWTADTPEGVCTSPNPSNPSCSSPKYIQALGKDPVWLFRDKKPLVISSNQRSIHTFYDAEITKNLTAAFTALNETGSKSFTMTWWAIRRNSHERIVFSFVHKDDVEFNHQIHRQGQAESPRQERLLSVRQPAAVPMTARFVRAYYTLPAKALLPATLLNATSFKVPRARARRGPCRIVQDELRKPCREGKPRVYKQTRLAVFEEGCRLPASLAAVVFVLRGILMRGDDCKLSLQLKMDDQNGRFVFEVRGSGNCSELNNPDCSPSLAFWCLVRSPGYTQPERRNTALDDNTNAKTIMQAASFLA